MAVDVVSIALGFIEQYGLIAIFILLVLDGALLLPVFPGELVLIMAVATYATDPGGLMMLVALSTAAAILGSLLLYAITRGGGRRLVERFPRFFMMPRKRRERLERAFRNPLGQSLVLFLRLFPLTRVLVSIPAGLAKMPVFRFVLMSTVGLALYHAGFLWFTYEARRPDSTVATQAAQLQEAYASPAWDFVQANAIATGAVLLLVGAILSVRSSRAMLRDPEEVGGSLAGSVAVLALFWGGMALAVMTYMDPETVFTLIALGGVDLDALAARLGFSPLQVLWGASALSVLLGYSVSRFRRAAQEKRKRDAAVQKALDAQRGAKAGTEPRDVASFRPAARGGPDHPPTPAREAGWLEVEPESDREPGRRAGDGHGPDAGP